MESSEKKEIWEPGSVEGTTNLNWMVYDGIIIPSKKYPTVAIDYSNPILSDFTVYHPTVISAADGVVYNLDGVVYNLTEPISLYYYSPSITKLRPPPVQLDLFTREPTESLLFW